MSCWGHNERGQLCDGTTDGRATAGPVSGGDRFFRISAGANSACGLRGLGELWCWGENDSGQLGDAAQLDHHIPFRVDTSTDWVEVRAGFDHTCARHADREVECWGGNSRGQQGNGVTGFTMAPVQVGTASDWEQVSAGHNFTCGVRTDGTLHCWGDGTTEERGGPVRVSTATWSDVAAGRGHTCAIQSDGSLWCWGWLAGEYTTSGSPVRTEDPTQIGSDTDWASVIVRCRPHLRHQDRRHALLLRRGRSRRAGGWTSMGADAGWSRRHATRHPERGSHLGSPAPDARRTRPPCDSGACYLRAVQPIAAADAAPCT